MASDSEFVSMVWSSSFEAKSPENVEEGVGFFNGDRLREVEGECCLFTLGGRGCSGSAPGHRIAFLVFLAMVSKQYEWDKFLGSLDHKECSIYKINKSLLHKSPATPFLRTLRSCLFANRQS